MNAGEHALEVMLRRQAELVHTDLAHLPCVVVDILAQALQVPHVHLHAPVDAAQPMPSAYVGCTGRPGVASLCCRDAALAQHVAKVAASQRSIYLAALAPGGAAEAGRAGSAYLLPISLDDALFGVAALLSAEPEGFPAALRALADRLARHLGETLATAHLLSGLRQANVQLQKAYEQLAAQERLRALGQMASGIVHDFNNVLTPIRGYAELLLLRPEATTNPAQVRLFAEDIYRAACDAADMVARLRAFYRPRETEDDLAAVDLNTLVEEALRLSEPRWRAEAQRRSRSIEVVCKLSSLPALGALEGELRQALLNLIFNAVDAMPEGGTLTLATSMAPERAARRPTVSYGPLPARFVCLEVSDTDIGMDEEMLQHCVEPFYTTKSDQGTGMGLASVYGTVLRHDGRLEIESALGHGTTVRLYLPAARPTDAPAVADGEQPAIPPQRILVADDEPGVRAFLSVALRLDGHTVVEVADGAAALAVLSMRPIDLLITDHGMPGMTGLDLARRVKQRWPRLPVILCTGYSSHLSIEVPLAEVAALLAKPPSLEALRRAVAHALAAR